MSWLEALILGIVQGLTEFLPVSSSGHLEIVKALLGDDSLPAESMLMTVVLHAATALSTVVIYRSDILRIFKGLFEFKDNSEFRFSLHIIISMIPAAFVGFFFEDALEALFDKNLFLVGSMLIITALLLVLADRAKRTDKIVGPVSAFIIGLSQAVAILPGISRSGATISTSVLLGIDRAEAARFSFLMVVPLILGKMAKDVLDGALSATAEPTALIVGFAAAFIAGLIACQWMIALVRKARLSWFALYCLAVGIASLIFMYL